MSKAAFVLGPKAGLALVDSFPGMAAVIAYRRPDGSVGIAMSATLAASWHPTPSDIPHSALRTPHSTLHTPHSALRTPHSAFTPQFALRIPHCGAARLLTARRQTP